MQAPDIEGWAVLFKKSIFFLPFRLFQLAVILFCTNCIENNVQHTYERRIFNRYFNWKGKISKISESVTDFI